MHGDRRTFREMGPGGEIGEHFLPSLTMGKSGSAVEVSIRFHRHRIFPRAWVLLVCPDGVVRVARTSTRQPLGCEECEIRQAVCSIAPAHLLLHHHDMLPVKLATNPCLQEHSPDFGPRRACLLGNLVVGAQFRCHRGHLCSRALHHENVFTA
jgi:hypothetical protein